jgi:hypothetical protein
MSRTEPKPSDTLAELVLGKLSDIKPMTKKEILAAINGDPDYNGTLTDAQITRGLNHLRTSYGKGVVVIDQRAHLSTYRLAADAFDVVDYGDQRAKTWHTQIVNIAEQMAIAKGLKLTRYRRKRFALAGHVLKAASCLLVGQLDPESEQFKMAQGDLLRALAALMDLNGGGGAELTDAKR